MPDPLDAVRRSFDERAATYDESAMHRDLASDVADELDLVGVDAVLDIATFATITHSTARPHSPYPRSHEPFASPEALAATFGPLGFALRSHRTWSDDDDVVIIAEFVMDAA